MDNREIDCLIAEKVLGIRVRHIQSMVDGKYYPMIDAKFGVANLPNYSTDITYAWQVIEKFPAIDIERYEKGWWCHIYTESKLMYNAFKDTAPLAICYAALKHAKVLEVTA